MNFYGEGEEDAAKLRFKLLQENNFDLKLKRYLRPRKKEKRPHIS